MSVYGIPYIPTDMTELAIAAFQIRPLTSAERFEILQTAAHISLSPGAASLGQAGGMCCMDVIMASSQLKRQ